MALPVDLNTLDYDHLGMPFCQGPSNAADILTTMDVDDMGAPFVANDTSQASVLGSYSLDRLADGFPYADTASVDTGTLDYLGDGFPFVTNVSGTGDIIFVAGTPVITISAPSVKNIGLERTFPLKRAEEIDSNSPLAHVFPYVAVQDTSLIP
jgi:hypothetical protein